ncbi:MAG: metal-dependent hydrolase [Saprospiraceae bacterium]|nr:metal-dependent hydrolase [Saprospiraceae bacterium]
MQLISLLRHTLCTTHTMTAPNHIAGGFSFTGIVGSIIGINILDDYRLIPIIIFASLLPDIDHPKSILGTIFRPISKAINKKYGHRTITHSLVVLVGLVALISAFQSVYFPDIPIATIFGLAYGSHLVFDMMTVQGVPLFYPFRKNACVIPGNPHMRLRTSNIRHETMIFCLFTVSAIFMKPLFANGFWTSYNSLFGTLKHIVSEYHKSEDLMIVDFTIQHGSEITTHQGLCIAVTPSKLTILTKKKQFQTYPGEGQQIKEIIPTHTKMLYSFEQGQYHNITIDSMHSLFRSGKFTKIEIQGSAPFIHVDHGIDHKVSTLSMDYPNTLILREIPNADTILRSENPSIQTKQSEIHLYRTKQKTEEAEYQANLKTYQEKQLLITHEQDAVTKELLMIEFAKMKPPTRPSGYQDQINKLQREIEAIKVADKFKYEEQLNKNKYLPLKLSGSYELVLINGEKI